MDGLTQLTQGCQHGRLYGNSTSIANVCGLLNLPTEVAAYYEKIGVKEVYDWQLECISSTSASNGRNLLYSAPTGGGKSLVAELILLMSVLTLHKKAIFVLPYVSLVLEKERQLRSLILFYNKSRQFTRNKIQVKSYYGDKNWLGNGLRENIIICTIDKANSILNSLLLRSSISWLGCVVIDEIHSLGDEFNGFQLETFISKIRLIQEAAKLAMNSSVNRNDGNMEAARPGSNTLGGQQPVESGFIQLVGMSATVGNLHSLANWLDAELFITEFRPIKLVESIIAGGELYTSSGESEQQKYSGHQNAIVCTLCRDALALGQQVLVFCPSKQACQDMVKHLVSSNEMCLADPKQTQRDQLSAKLKLIGAKQPSDQLSLESALSEAMTRGFAFHHAGVCNESRLLIEKAFRDGVVKVLAATSTLAAGVNLPAGRVIIKSLRIGRDVLKTSQYKQMVGRAGRPGYSSVGESFLIVEKSELPLAFSILNGVLPTVVSQLNPLRNGFRLILKAILEVYGLGLATTRTHAIHFLQLTLLYQESVCLGPEFVEDIITITESVVAFLVKADALNLSPRMGSSAEGDVEALSVSKFGKAIVQCGLNPDEATVVYKALLDAHDGLDLTSSIHLLYIVTPVDHTLYPNFVSILNWYDRGVATSAKTKAPEQHFLGNLLQLRTYYGLLTQWAQLPPTREDCSKCYPSLCGASIALLSKSVLKQQEGKSTANQKSTSYWSALCICMRLWGSFCMNELSKGKPVALLCKEFSANVSDILNLQYSMRIMICRIERLCKELGWKSLEAMCQLARGLIYPGKTSQSKCKELLDIPVITPKLADLLVDYGLQTVAQLASANVADLAEYVRLKSEFEVQELEYVERQMRRDNDENESIAEGSAPPMRLSRDEEMRGRLRAWMNMVVTAAKEKLSAIEEDASRLSTMGIVTASTDNANDSDRESEMSTRSDDSSEVSDDNFSGDDTAYNLSQSDEEEGALEVAYGSFQELKTAALKLQQQRQQRKRDQQLNRSNQTKLVQKRSRSEEDNNIPSLGIQSTSRRTAVEAGEALPNKSIRRESFSLFANAEVLEDDLTRDSMMTESTSVVTMGSECEITDDELLDCMHQWESSEEYTSLLVQKKSLNLEQNQHKLPSKEFRYFDNITGHKPAEKGGDFDEIEPKGHGALLDPRGILSKYIDGISSLLIPDSPYKFDCYDEDIINKHSSEEECAILFDDDNANLEAEVANTQVKSVSDQSNSSPMCPVLPSKAVSTPLTASAARQSVGTYLCLPLSGVGLRSVEKVNNAAMGSTFRRQQELKSLKKRNSMSRRRDVSSPNFLSASDYFAVCATTPVPTQVQWADQPLDELGLLQSKAEALDTIYPNPTKHTTVLNANIEQNCRSFLQRIIHCIGFAFELRYRKLPNQLFKGNQTVSSLIEIWRPYASAFYGQDAAVCGSCSQRNLLQLYDHPRGVITADPAAALLVIAGISISFDNSESYYLPLPCPLPVTSVLLGGSIETGLTALLPFNCCVAISQFVGYAGILDCCPYIAAKYRSKGWKPSIHQLTNPLLFVSKKWARIAREGLTRQWNATGCSPWLLINDIMFNLRIAKISANLQTAICALRQRGVVVNGQLEDPCIAAALLRNAGYADSSKINYKQPLPKGSGSNGKDNTKDNDKVINELEYTTKPEIGAKAIPVDEQIAQVGNRTTAVLRSMAYLARALRKHAMLELFLNVEMPVTRCVAEIEFVGMPVCLDTLSYYCKLTADRMQRIEIYFNLIQKKYKLDQKMEVLKKNLIEQRSKVLLQQQLELRSAASSSSSVSSLPAPAVGRQLEILAAKASSQAEVDVESHPLLCLHKEYQLLSLSLHKLCSTMMQHAIATGRECGRGTAEVGLRAVARRAGRVRAQPSVVGTNTGRMTFKSPAMQQVG